jgi:hypothetical protein
MEAPLKKSLRPIQKTSTGRRPLTGAGKLSGSLHPAGFPFGRIDHGSLHRGNHLCVNCREVLQRTNAA